MDTRKELEQKIINRAMRDETFRNKLKADPKSAIEETLRIKLPDDIKININMESANDVHITIPHTGDELTEEELSGVSGGWEAKGGSMYGLK